MTAKKGHKANGDLIGTPRRIPRRISVYHKTRYGDKHPKPSLCAHQKDDLSQCQRENGFGPHGAFCRLHARRYGHDV